MLGACFSVSFSRTLQNAFLFTIGVQASWYYAVKGLAVNPGDTVRSLHQVTSEDKALMDSLEKAKKLAAFRAVDDFVKVKILQVVMTVRTRYSFVLTADD